MQLFITEAAQHLILFLLVSDVKDTATNANFASKFICTYN